MPENDKVQQRREITTFSAAVADDEVQFVACLYREWLERWSGSGMHNVRAHAQAVMARDAPVHTLRGRPDGDSRWTDPRLDMRGFNKRDVKSHRMCHYVARRSVGLIFAVLRRWRAI
ncbi:MAG: hypothetical protein OXC53_05460 [Rhodobacteraceae bacterium]|nr:hypothetical protein [Paracoccaceae bacterium]